MRRIASLTAFLFAAAITGPAVAQPDHPSPAAVEAGGSAESALSLAEMEEASGGQGVTVEVLTRQQLSGSTSGNTVNAGTLTSGDVSFGAEALDGFSGIGNFVINTGANNTLQGAINISVVTTPPS